MKILIIAFSDFKKLHGANLRIFHIIKEAEKRGHKIDLIVPDKTAAESCKQHFKSPVKHLNISLSRFSRKKVFKYPIFSIKSIFKIRKNYDIIFGQSLPPILGISLSLKKGIRFFDIPDLWSEYWLYSRQDFIGKIVYFLTKLAENFCIKRADYITTVTPKQRELLSERAKVNKNKIYVVPEGVDTDKFKPLQTPDSIYKKYNIDKNKKYLICQGGIEAHDGMQFLVEALPEIIKKYPDIMVLIAGTGHYLKFLKQKIQKKNLEKYFNCLGWVDYSDMQYLMNIAVISLVLLPNHNACKGIITIKLLESLASGIPVIAGNLPGIKYAVKHKESGYLINSENSNEIKNAVIELLEDKEFRNKLSKNGRKQIEKFDWKKGADTIVNLMEEKYENFSN